MKDLLAENSENFWKNILRKILRTFVFGKYIVETPPPPVANIFRGKYLVYGKKIFRGPWNGRGPKFWTTPPQSETGWRGPDHGLYFDTQVSHW